jgi:uncharacterized BrkB/YihY/UPF0761 family membrane protein
MWYRAEHKRSFWKKHALDIGTAVGMLVVLGLPVWLWMIGAV